MNISHEQRDSAYRATTGRTRELYDGDATGEAIKKIFDSYHLPQELYREYALAIGDVILGLSPKEHLAKTLATQAGISEKIAPLVAKELIEFLELELGRARTSNPAPSSSTTTNLDRGAPVEAPPQHPPTEVHAKIPTAPAWSSAPQPASPTVEAPVPEEKPFYPRVPNYSKPFTTPTPSSTPPTPNGVSPRPVTPPPAPQPRANDPYHEPI